MLTAALMVATALFVLAVLTITGARALDDLAGWQNTRWGMTEQEVKRSIDSLGLSLMPLPDSYKLALDARTPFKTTIEIDGSYYDAIFLFPNDTQRLGRVVLSTIDYSREHALILHGRLLRTLTEKYGRPGETESLGPLASFARWIFKTTLITLSLYTDSAVPGRHVTHVAITYAPPTATPKDPKDMLLGLGLLRALGEVGRSSR